MDQLPPDAQPLVDCKSTVVKSPCFSPPDTFCFLNESRRVVRPKDWNEGSQSYLWHYNLHYGDYLLSREMRAEPALSHAWIDRWIQENPPFAGPGWEPYPVSLRIVNWLKSGWEVSPLSKCHVRSLALQVRHLARRLEWHLRANHLFTNGKALVFAGLAFTGAEADRWLDQGLSILSNELEEQFLADGGHFERCPMYQGILLEDLLDLIQVLRAYPFRITAPDLMTRKERILDALRTALVRGLQWMRLMRHPDGNIPLFNDSAFAISPDYPSICDYAERVGIDWQNEPTAPDDPAGVHVLDKSGFTVMRNEHAVIFWETGGPAPAYQPGHAHAGTLGLEMSVSGQRLLVDTGVSTYDPGPVREYQRSTRAHNTLVLDGKNSSEVWSSFRVGRRAICSPVQTSHEGNVITGVCSHNGYHVQRLAGKHTRKLRLEENALTINDEMDGKGVHEIALPFHLHPDWTTELADDPCRAIFRHRESLTPVSFKVCGAIWHHEQSTYHPEFGLSQNNLCLIAVVKTVLPATINVRIEWGM